MIHAGFLDGESRQDLIELARDGLAQHRLGRRANALVSLEDDTVRSWYELYQQDGIDGLAGFGHACDLRHPIVAIGGRVGHVGREVMRVSGDGVFQASPKMRNGSFRPSLWV
jgi:hypothetical protein